MSLGVPENPTDARRAPTSYKCSYGAPINRAINPVKPIYFWPFIGGYCPQRKEIVSPSHQFSAACAVSFRKGNWANFKKNQLVHLIWATMLIRLLLLFHLIWAKYTMYISPKPELFRAFWKDSLAFHHILGKFPTNWSRNKNCPDRCACIRVESINYRQHWGIETHPTLKIKGILNMWLLKRKYISIGECIICIIYMYM